MKSLFVDKSKDFFEMLSFDKGKWPSFYFEYIKNAPRAFSLYHELLNVDEKKISERMFSFERRYIDSCYQSIRELAPYKYEMAHTIVRISERKDMDLSKVRVYIMGALRFGAIFVLDKNSVFVDVLSLYDNGFSKLPKLVEYAFRSGKAKS